MPVTFLVFFLLFSSSFCFLFASACFIAAAIPNMVRCDRRKRWYWRIVSRAIPEGLEKDVCNGCVIQSCMPYMGYVYSRRTLASECLQLLRLSWCERVAALFCSLVLCCISGQFAAFLSIRSSLEGTSVFLYSSCQAASSFVHPLPRRGVRNVFQRGVFYRNSIWTHDSSHYEVPFSAYYLMRGRIPRAFQGCSYKSSGNPTSERAAELTF